MSATGNVFGFRREASDDVVIVAFARRIHTHDMEEQGESAAPPVEPIVPAAPPEPPPPTVWQSFVTLALSLVFVLGSGVVIAIGLMLNNARQGIKVSPLDLMTSPGVIVASAFVTQVALFISVRFFPVLLKDVGPDGWLARVRWEASRLHLGRVVLAWLGTLATGSLATYILEPLRQASDILTRFAEVARNASPVLFAMLLLVGAIAPGIAEELMFRGLLQTRFIQRWGPVAGIATTALLFGAYHFDIRQGLAAMAMGWWIGWLAWRDGSIVNVAFGHMLNNGTAFLLSRFTPQVEAHERSPAVFFAALFLLLACIAAGTFINKQPKEVAA